MTYQSLDLGTSADDGTGDSLRLGGDKLNDNFSELYTLLGTGSTLTTGISATGSVVTLNSAVGTFTTLTPASADGTSLGSASLEFSDIYLYDSSVIYFGIDSEITLTHVHNVGLTLTHVTADDNLPIVLQLKSEEDAIVADEVIASIEFAAGDSDGTDGATVAAGIHAIAEGTFSASANATKLVFTTGVSETAASSATAKMTLSSAGLLTIADDFMIKDGGTIGVASTNDALTISSAGLLTVKDDLVIKTGGTIGGANDTDLLTLTSAVLTVAGEVVGTGFTGTLDGILGSGAAAAATTTTLASTTITASGIIKTDDTTAATSTTDGSLQTDGGLSVAGDAVIGDDLLLLSDAAVLSFGANSEVTLTHVHNDGLLLNSDNQLQFRDSAINIRSDDDGDLDINADDEIELNSTLIDVNGNLDVSGTIVSAGVITGTAFTAGSAVLAEAELELLDGLTAGTAIASKVVTTDASIDTTGQRNLTISGELDAATLDISGAIDVAGNSVLASVDVTGVATAATFEPDGDTAAGDNAAIGYTAAEGLILTGQGSTGDVTIKNDADALVCFVPTGTDDLRFPDNAVLQFGTGADLTINHDGSNSFITDGGTGALYIQGTSGVFIRSGDGGENLAGFTDDGAATLYHNNVARIATTATGTITTGDNATIIDTSTDANFGPYLDLSRDSASPADNDGMGIVRFLGDNDAGEATHYASMHVINLDMTDGTEDGALQIDAILGGTVRSRALFNSTETIFNQDAQDLDFRVESSGNANMLFVDAGNDRIGIGTAAPTAELHINAATPEIIIHEGNTNTFTSGNVSSSLRFQARNSDVRDLAQIDAVHASTNGTIGALRFQTRHGDALGERMRIISDGKVGIGTTAPASLLEIKAAALNRANGISFVGSGANDILYIYPSADNTATIEHLIDGSTSTGGALAINPQGGTVGIVNSGASTAVGWIFNDTGFLQHARASGAAQSMTGFYNGGSLVGEIRSSTTATAFLTSSDYRLKKEVVLMTNALAKVAKLKPCTYKWKSNGEASQGFIAHELQEVVPEAVAGVKDELDEDGKPKYQGVDSSFLVATLTAAIQEQQATIEALTARITTLEG